MVTLQVKLSVEDIINTLHDLDTSEREKLQIALADMELEQAVNEGLDDINNGRVTPHETVMKQIKAKYNY